MRRTHRIYMLYMKEDHSKGEKICVSCLNMIKV